MIEYTPRLNGFQIRDVNYLGGKPKNAPIKFDIVKWEKNDPPIEVLDLETGKKRMSKEHCYSVAQLVWNEREPCFEFRSVGLRWLECNADESVVQMILRFAKMMEVCLENGREDLIH